MKKSTQFHLEDQIRGRMETIKEELKIRSNLLEMVPCRPHRDFQFQDHTEIYKGKFQCKSCAKIWSSSKVQVIVNFKSYPEPLHKLQKCLKRNQKCQIYFFVRLYGQSCGKCKTFLFTTPDFGKTEEQRIIDNFTSFLYNKISNTKEKIQTPCSLKILRKHLSEFCQACKKGKCQKSGGNKKQGKKVRNAGRRH